MKTVEKIFFAKDKDENISTYKLTLDVDEFKKIREDYYKKYGEIESVKHEFCPTECVEMPIFYLNKDDIGYARFSYVVDEDYDFIPEDKKMRTVKLYKPNYLVETAFSKFDIELDPFHQGYFDYLKKYSLVKDDFYNQTKFGSTINNTLWLNSIIDFKSENKGEMEFRENFLNLLNIERDKEKSKNANYFNDNFNSIVKYNKNLFFNDKAKRMLEISQKGVVYKKLMEMFGYDKNCKDNFDPNKISLYKKKVLRILPKEDKIASFNKNNTQSKELLN